MSVSQKIFGTCAAFVMIIAALGGLAHQQVADMGRLAIGIYDSDFLGMAYVDQAQEEFLRIAATHRTGEVLTAAELDGVLQRLDVALERADRPQTRSAGAHARRLLTELPSVASGDIAEAMAETDHVITKLVRRFSADGLEARDQAEELAQHSGNLVLKELTTAIGMALVIGWLVGRNLSRPLRQLVGTIDRLATGQLEHEIDCVLLDRRDEVGAVARATAVFRTAMLRNSRIDAERALERERNEAEKRRVAAIELDRLLLLSNLSQEILVIVREGIVLQVNEAGGRTLGISTEQLIGRPLLELVADADQSALLRRLQAPEADAVVREIHLNAVDGAHVPVEFSCTTIDYQGQPATVLALRDQSEHKRDEARIRHLAHHDALTNLPNRFLLQDRLTHALRSAERTQIKGALLYLDLDHFKPVNDLLGHAAGDMLLVQVAARLQGELRVTDTLARIGGDEFIIVVTERVENLRVLARRLIEVLSLPFALDGHEVQIGTSIGVAVFPDDGATKEGLMQAADTALYHAKREERGTYRFFEPLMNEELRTRQQLERDLRGAIDRSELKLHYQPMVNCMTGEVDGFEALLRWDHPERGFVPPLEFIPIAEETGLITKIGNWVLETACVAAAGWPEPHRVAVNVSPAQFRRSDLTAVVSATLAATGLAAARLEIEITEGVLMEDAGRAAEILAALRQLGVQIALDDFGTGYSSLSYLHAFKFDKLKIDRSFVAPQGESQEAALIVQTIIGLAHNLGLATVAEGVETVSQLGRMRDLGCSQVQGYLLGRPLQMDGSTELVALRARTLIAGCKADPDPEIAIGLGFRSETGRL